jgi:hypothetical protein
MSDSMIPIERVHAKIAEIDREIRHLEARRADLLELLGGAVNNSNGTDSSSSQSAPSILPFPRRVPSAPASSSGNGAPSMSVAILQAAAAEPHGLKPFEIVDRALATSKTSSSDPRRMVFSYIASLRKDGRLAHTPENRIVITEKGRKFVSRMTGK